MRKRAGRRLSLWRLTPLFVMSCCVSGLRLERSDWMAQAEQLKQQTLATLSDRDQQLRQLSAMLEEARAGTPKLQQERYQREVGVAFLEPQGFHQRLYLAFWFQAR